MKTLVTALTVALYLVFLSFQPALAGAPPLQWQKTFGGSGPDEGYSVQQTSDGGYIIAGATWSSDTGNWDVYLVKTDPNGNSEWEKTFGPSERDFAASVHQTSDGGYIITGDTSSLGTGDADVYLVKTDPNGNSQWQKNFGGTSDDHGLSVQQTSDGGYIIAGYTEVYTMGNNVYLIKTDPNGNSMWQKTFGWTDSEHGFSVQQTSDGGYIIAGFIWLTFDSQSDVYLIKIDPNGILKWQKTFGANNYDFGRSVQQTTDGGYIIAGYTNSYGAGRDDVYLIKTDPNGNKKWQKTFGGSDVDDGYSVQQTSDGGYIIVGFIGGVGTSPIRGGDVYLIKTDSNGNSQWQKTFGDSSYADRGYSVKQTFDGGYIIAGSTASYGAGSNDVYLIKLCSDGTLSADFNCNGTVYYEDLEVLVAQWLQPPDILSADIYPELGDGIVNAFDFAVLANVWLQSTIP